MSVSDEMRDKAGERAAAAIIYNLPVDGFGQSARLRDYALIWGNAAGQAVLDAIAGDIRKQVAEEVAAEVQAQREGYVDPVDDEAWKAGWRAATRHHAYLAREIGGQS